jgi:hypothetical protein
MTERIKMWTTLIPAIIGFVGVLVGAGITTGTNYLLAVRKEKQKRPNIGSLVPPNSRQQPD